MVLLVLLVVPAVAIFSANGSLAALQLSDTVSNAISTDPGSMAAFLAGRFIGMVQLLVALGLGFVAGWLVLKGLGLPFKWIGGGAGNWWRWLEARFYDHRAGMLMIGYFALMLTVLLFMNVPAQFQPTINDDNSRVQIDMVPGTTLETTEQVVDRVADLLYKQPEVERALERVRIGNGTIYITLKADRKKTSIEFERDLARFSRRSPMRGSGLRRSRAGSAAGAT